MGTLRRGRLADLQAQQVEVGRIRLGTSQTKVSRAGKEYNEPVKLDRFRLTSRSEQLIREAAELYGGDPGPWTPQNGGAPQWEVIVERQSLGVIVPPDPVSQFYELWSGGKCQARCDGARELLEDRPCVCLSRNPDPAARKCKPTTRLSLMLAEMNGVGVWRLETHGYYAAVELPAVADLLSAAGGNVMARLEMEERSAIVEVNGKDTTTRFMVPVLHVEATPLALVATFGNRGAIEPPTHQVPALESGPQTPTDVGPALEAPPVTAARMPFASYREQIAKAGSRAELMAARRFTEDMDNMTQEEVTTLTSDWNTRAQQVRAQEQAAQSAAPPAAAPAESRPAAATPPQRPGGAPAPTPVSDRTSIWLQIQTWAGYRGLKTSDIAARFGQWGQAGDDIRQADAAQLGQFYQWLNDSEIGGQGA